MSSLPLGLCPCYLSLGHVSVGHPVFTGRLHPQGWRNLRHRLLSDSAGHATGEGAQGGGSHWDWQLCVIPAARLAGESPPCPSSLRSSQQAGSAKAATLILHNCLSSLTLGEGGAEALMAGAGLAFVTLKAVGLQQGGEAGLSFDTWCFLSVNLGVVSSQSGIWGQSRLGRPLLIPAMVMFVGPVSEQGNRLSSKVQALTFWGQLVESWLVIVEKVL